MQAFLSFASAFCIAAVFIGALSILCPDGKMSKPVKFALSLVFLVSVVSVAGISVKKAEMPDFSAEISVNPDSLTDLAAEQTVKLALEKAGISYKKITVITNKTETGDIVISKVTVVSGEQKEKIQKALNGVEVDVINE